MTDDKKQTNGQEHHDVVKREEHSDTMSLLDSLFSNLGEAKRHSRSVVNANFSTPEGERAPTKSKLLKHASAENPEQRESPTLREQVRGMLKG